MFIHDIIKIQLSRQGYLMDYPPHLISDAEMCDAFLPYVYDKDDPTSGYEDSMNLEINYFRDTYPLVDDSLLEEYKTLVSEIAYHINKLKTTTEADYVLPDWVYSYMLGVVVSENSPLKDRHDLFVLLGTDNLYDEFNTQCAQACYKESVNWLAKLPESQKVHRPPTMFGEPHVIKSLRVKALTNKYLPSGG
ncbi:MAG: hypothetical protein IJE78_05215 [Bacteroidaceae bacterium]|nr:hypothetical protein [Bacteroidaceae bacterium]